MVQALTVPCTVVASFGYMYGTHRGVLRVPHPFVTRGCFNPNPLCQVVGSNRRTNHQPQGSDGPDWVSSMHGWGPVWRPWDSQGRSVARQSTCSVCTWGRFIFCKLRDLPGLARIGLGFTSLMLKLAKQGNALQPGRRFSGEAGWGQCPFRYHELVPNRLARCSRCASGQ